MSSGIVKPYDRLFSTEGTEWHGQSEVVEVIDENSIKPILFPVRENKTFCEIDGIRVESPNGKMLVADLRELRPDLSEMMEKGEKDDDGNEITNLVSLHTPKDSYERIQNKDTFEAAQRCIADIVGAKFTSAFTLEKCSIFGLSANIGSEDMSVKRFNGETDKILGVLNIITSHNGKYACQAYDSTVRVVCMNTLRWSLEAAGQVGFKVYHTRNADSGMKKFPELVNAILAGRVKFKNDMEYFDSLEISKDAALYLALAYLDSAKPKKANSSEETETSTRLLNTAEAIQLLFLKGKGNYGKTAYDLLNGVTEYYTVGDGTGQKSDDVTKAYKANFGKAADHKNAFVNFLYKNLEEETEKGRKLYVEAMSE